MKIKNIKCIDELTFEFPLKSGLYAITGENGAGKTTLISCASSVFFHLPMKECFGNPNGALINFQLDDTERTSYVEDRVWKQRASKKKMLINGFFEGSLIFGNRFRDCTLGSIRSLESITDKDVYEAPKFISENLGEILHEDLNFYNNLYVVKKEKADKLKLTKQTFMRKVDDNKYISQHKMSTGENLLVSILYSIYTAINKRTNKYKDISYVIFLDEIELALHSSALRRLILFLKKLSIDEDLIIYFSTHSLELLREIKPENIYYLSVDYQGKIGVTNPCYPAFATRNLYGNEGSGYDIVILVEDDLANLIVDKLWINYKIGNSMRKLILPTGGWTKTIELAYDITTANMLQKGTRLAVILDKDIASEVPNFLENNKKFKGVKVDYLPMPSLEKYLKNKLIISCDRKFENYLDSYLFQKRSVKDLLREYKNILIDNKKDNDENGKTLFGVLINELYTMKKSRDDIVDFVVRYILDNETESLKDLKEYLQVKIIE